MSYTTEQRLKSGKLAGWPTDIASVCYRFWSKVKIGKPNECWEWQASISKDGYGQFCGQHKSYQAHRFSMKIKLGRDLKKDELICHKCDNRKCVNPNHLFIGTPLTNMQDRDNKGRHRAVRGQDSGTAKLDETSVREIRNLIRLGVVQREVADRFKVSPSLITRIKKGLAWQWLK